MTSSPARQILADNLRRLMAAREDLRNPNRVGARPAGPDQRTIDRLIKLEVAPTLTTLESVARVFSVEPWQLLLPNLNPDDPPARVLLRSEADSWRAMLLAAETITKYRR